MSVTVSEPLLAGATATVYLDGLIFLLHNGGRGLCRALIHTGAAHHALRIEVSDAAGGAPLFPTEALPWNGSHDCVRDGAPFWLYVDEGAGRPDQFSASLFKPDDLSDQRSFGHVIDFESKFYDHELRFHRTAPAAELNIADGTLYSAQNATMLVKSFAQDEDPGRAVGDERIPSSVLVAADIARASEEGVERHLVLEQSNVVEGCAPRREIFRLRLDAGRRLIVKLLNIPVHEHDDQLASLRAHFLKYYDLFALEPDERVFFLQAEKPPQGGGGEHPSGGPHPHGPQFTADSPPCNVGRGSKTTI